MARRITHRDPPGGRHDNDHADIFKIKIMPTFQEICSPHAEYLPVKDPRQWHLNGMAGLIDRNFRLLREDTVGQLRDVVHSELQKGTRKTQTKAHVYKQVTIQTIDLHRFSGMRFLVRFTKPPNLRGFTPQKRKEWWDLSRRLIPGALVCLLDQAGLAVFCTVCPPDRPNERRNPLQNKSKMTASISENPQYASIVLELVEPTEDNWKFILDYRVTSGETTQRISSISLVEFPGILLQSFQSTLLALQKMQQAEDTPMSEILAPGSSGLNSRAPMIKIPQPTYTLSMFFRFDLKCLLDNDESSLLVHPSRLGPTDIDQLQQHSTLDHAQAEAVVKSLQRQVALIQGPPGTGKSFTGVAIIKAILANKHQVYVEDEFGEVESELGPIICVCYTNHALDQLLEELLNNDITKKIVRIGSQSRSERIQPLNLRTLAREVPKEGPERQNGYALNSLFNQHEDAFDNIRVNDCGSGTGLKHYLQDNYPSHYHQLFETERSGFHRQDRQGPGYAIRSWLNGGKSSTNALRSVEELDGVHVNEMTQQERKILHEQWIKEHKEDVDERAKSIFASHTETKEAWDTYREGLDLKCLRSADIIGLTTSGLARNVKMLRRLHSRVLICEEAGEVLEAHLLTSLLPSLAQLILIGDHRQLRPQVSNYGLSRESPEGQKYALDQSLFERLVEPDGARVRIPHCTLQTQRRMDPSISRLIRDTIYPRLQDASSVAEYPQVPGMRKRLFWLDHRHPDSEGNAKNYNPTATSNWNDKEVELTVALVRHLSNQGIYKNGDIAVLTPYLGQLHRLRKGLASLFAVTLGENDEEKLKSTDFSGDCNNIQKESASKPTLLQSVRVATIDNFQGEEAKVVVISLVRSNNKRYCGFLRISNRINVLLSRAKHGMYIIGNSETYKNVGMWQKVIRTLEQDGNLDSHFELSCSRHPETSIPVKDPQQFLQLSPEGGCSLPCGLRLSCGHPCTQKCHSEMLHQAVYCAEPCHRPRSCTHPCTKPCGDACPKKCMVQIVDSKKTLPCGHHKPESLPCWQAQDLALVECTELIDKQISHCKHIVNVPCNTDVDIHTYPCKQPCHAVLPCGHDCKENCAQCIKKTPDGPRVAHGICKQKCGRNYSTCSHSCAEDCHGEAACPPCPEPCEVQCGHSKCPRKCSEPCTPCAVSKCLSSCPHSTCSMPCAAPCDHIPCSLRCEKRLSCGHQCPSVCGEICPSKKFCQICAPEDILESTVDFIEMKSYREINLAETPCIFPPCGHFLTIESMDGQMDIKKHYGVGEMGQPISISTSSQPFSMGDIQTCASCRGSLRSLSRYGRLVRRAMLDEGTKRLILYLNQEYVPLAQELPEVLTALQRRGTDSSAAADVFPFGAVVRIEGSPSHQVSTMSSLINKRQKARWVEILAFRQRVMRYHDRVKLEEQPFNQVRTFVEDARRRRRTSGQFGFDEGILQTKGTLQAASLRQRLDMALLGDFFALKKSIPVQLDPNDLVVDLAENRLEAQRLVDDAKQAHRVLQQVEGNVFLAQLYALELQWTGKTSLSQSLREKGLAAIKAAAKLCKRYPEQTRGLAAEVAGTKDMFTTATFYTPVSNEERLAVVKVMAREFQGTGHWYYCANGHPFTIGECGGAIEVSRCPECGTLVGGQEHLTVNGVRRADDLERITSALIEH